MVGHLVSHPTTESPVVSRLVEEAPLVGFVKLSTSSGVTFGYDRGDLGDRDITVCCALLLGEEASRPDGFGTMSQASLLEEPTIRLLWLSVSL